MPVMTWHPYLGNQRCYWSRSSLQRILKHAVRLSYNTIWSQCVQEDTCRGPKGGLSGFSNFWNYSRRSRARVVGVRTTLFPQTAVASSVCSSRTCTHPDVLIALHNNRHASSVHFEHAVLVSTDGDAHMPSSVRVYSVSIGNVLVAHEQGV